MEGFERYTKPEQKSPGTAKGQERKRDIGAFTGLPKSFAHSRGGNVPKVGGKQHGKRPMTG